MLSGVNVEQLKGPDNKPVYVDRAKSAGQRALNTGSSKVINNGPNGVPYGEPEKEFVWARNPDGTVELDERGALRAISRKHSSRSRIWPC